MNRNLFWFLKDDAKIRLDKPAELDMYVQQVITRGRAIDVKNLLKSISPLQFRESFHRLSRFLPFEVKKFWEDYLGNTRPSAKRNP